MTILVADDDADDRLLMSDAFDERAIANPVHYVNDGVELMDYLHREGPYAKYIDQPYPGVVLLDLNMPKKDGRTALREIRQDPKLKRIPVVILTTAKSGDEIERVYKLGATSFLSKPVAFESLCDIVQVLSQYWGGTVVLPPECRP